MTACEICKGACCESAIIRFEDKEEAAWHVMLRGRRIDDHHVEFEVPCCYLVKGRCSIHPDRPATCRRYAVGGELCRATVERRRSEEVFDNVMLAVKEGRV
jgi:Fe-S-cluster containining protein